jgi:hypothetical protein
MDGSIGSEPEDVQPEIGFDPNYSEAEKRIRDKDVTY